jgi:hypothetical protein
MIMRKFLLFIEELTHTFDLHRGVRWLRFLRETLGTRNTTSNDRSRLILIIESGLSNGWGILNSYNGLGSDGLPSASLTV